MLSLREFDSITAPAVYSDTASCGPDDMMSTVLRFGAQPSDGLPSFIASFAYPVHVESALSESDSDALVDDGSEWQEMDVVAQTPKSLSHQSPKPNRPVKLDRSV